MPYEYHDYDDKFLSVVYHYNKIDIDEPWWPHWHKCIELLLVTSGDLTVGYDGSQLQFKKGEIAVIESNVIHSTKTEGECEYHCLIIEPSIYDDISGLPHRVNDERIKGLYLDIVTELEKKDNNFRIAITGYIKTLISLISRISDGNSKGVAERFNIKKFELVKRATQYIYENYQRDISLDEIAGSIGISKYYLSHIFKEATGKTVLSHLNHARCVNAYSMLTSGGCTVREAAVSNGFTNLSYFSKTYKSIMGNSPVCDLKV